MSLETTPEPTTPPEIELFAARLLPYRSMPMSGFILLCLLMGIFAITTGLMFIAIGAWPIFGFLGLDLLLLLGAFWWNYRSAQAFEDITITPTLVTLTRVSAGGQRMAIRLNPLWVRLESDRIADEGVVALRLVGHGKPVSFGAFLNPDDKESLCEAMMKALNAARRGVALGTGGT